MVSDIIPSVIVPVVLLICERVLISMVSAGIYLVYLFYCSYIRGQWFVYIVLIGISAVSLYLLYCSPVRGY